MSDKTIDRLTDWEKRVRAYEEQGCTRSDAQAIVDAEDAKADRLTKRAGHTTGPWTKDGSSIEAHWEGGETIQIASMNVTHWSTDPAHDDVELNRARNVRMRRETEANARLIAAAPELLGALKLAFSYTRAMECMDPQAVEQIREAIAKAEGKDA